MQPSQIEKEALLNKVCASKLKVLSDKSRFKILKLLSKNAMHANEILSHLDISQTLLSHHLKILKNNGLIEGKKSGQFITYRLNSENKSSLAKNTLNLGCCEIKFNDNSF